MSVSRGITLVLATALTLSVACAPGSDAPSDDEGDTAAAMDRVAEEYVKLVLAVGQHDSDYVDAYYGPPGLKESVEAEQPSLERIRERAAALINELPAGAGDEDEMERLRREYLGTTLGALVAHVDRLGGKTMTFDEESKALYDAVAPVYADEHFQAVIDEMESLLPGSGLLTDRYEAFRKEFIIPKEKLDEVFRKAIEACKVRTQKYLDLPPGESFEIEYVNDKPWSGYNWYQGEFKSLIQVNTDLPIYIDRAIDLACHEGYPGHHVYNVLLEWRLTRQRGWVEFTIYPLFSPQSLIAEGTANFGIEMAFPGEERVAWEKENLFPVAGMDPAKASLYYEIQETVDKLDYAGNEAARRYLDGLIDAEGAVEQLMRYSLMPRDRAEQKVRFIDKYRSYVINYNLGKDLVREFLQARAGEDPGRRWEEFGKLISSPRLPSGLE
jgi:hypothetical protein